MERLLFLSQRIPYPPDKGEKIRAWNMLRHLAARYEVHLGCFHDTPEDAQYIPALEKVCASVCCPRLVPWQAKLASLGGLAGSEPLTFRYFANEELRRWVEATLETERPAQVFVFCSAMAPYVRDWRYGARILDMVDVDSDKWRQYAATKSWPLRAIYEREHRTLLSFERAMAGAFDATLLVSDAEADFFRTLAPEAAPRIHALPNGIDAQYFDPERDYPNPFGGSGPHMVFTGAMDYWPNVQAVRWLAAEILPGLQLRWPGLEFHVVGSSPAPAVRALARKPGVGVTGRVPDVRPYLKHADAVVAPLRIARGTQNKVLEAMAMARPVIATPEAAQGIRATAGHEILVAATAADFAASVSAVLAGEAASLGDRARRRVLRDCRWNFDLLDGIMERGKPLLASG